VKKHIHILGAAASGTTTLAKALIYEQYWVKEI
jgi:adenylate kinase family enzyme